MTSSILAQIKSFNRGRDPRLVKLKLKRMAESPFCFFRGSDHLFAAAWRKLGPADAGPDLLCCGDLHLENFGLFATDDDETLFGINDFDEALVASASFDLVRCATSVFLAAEEWRLLPVDAAHMALAFITSYRQAIAESERGGPRQIILGKHHCVFDLLGGEPASQDALLEIYTEKTKSGERQIIRDKKRFELEKPVRQRVEQALAAYFQKKGETDRQTLDVTGRIAGIGSLGVDRYCALVRDGAGHAPLRLLDIKAALPSAARAATRAKQPKFASEANRVVTAQRTIQGITPRGLDALMIARQSFRLRELVPDEHRYRLDAFQQQPERLLEAVKIAGQITGWSHYRASAPAKTPKKDTKKDSASKKAAPPKLTSQLLAWSQGPAAHACLASAIHFARRTQEQYQAFMAQVSL